MSNPITDTLNSIEMSYGMPKYNYVTYIPTPSDKNISNDGDLGTTIHDAEQLITWMDPLITASGDSQINFYNNLNASTCIKDGRFNPICKGFYNTGTGPQLRNNPGPLGNAYKVQTGWCKDGKTPRWTWINNIPDGKLYVLNPSALASMGKDALLDKQKLADDIKNLPSDFIPISTGMKGLIPGILEDITDINPLNMLKAVSGQDDFFKMCPPNSQNPDCCANPPEKDASGADWGNREPYQSGCSFCAPPASEDQKKSINSQIKIANEEHYNDLMFSKNNMKNLLSVSDLKEPYENYNSYHKYELIIMLFIICFLWLIIFKIKK